MTSPRFRDDLVAPLAWMTAGGCWIAQLFVAWTSSGPLAASSVVDGVRLLRSGTVSSVAPTWIAFVLLLLPAAGVGVLALASVDGATATGARAVLAAVGVLLVVAALYVLVSFDPSRLGPGAILTLAGGALALAGCRLDRPSLRS